MLDSAGSISPVCCFPNVATFDQSEGQPMDVPELFSFVLQGGNLMNTVWDQEGYGDTGLGTLLRQPE